MRISSALPGQETPINELLFVDLDRENRVAIRIRRKGHGGGTPYPETPLSQRRYDGEHEGDDVEQWL